MSVGETTLLEQDFTGSYNVCYNIAQCSFLHKKQESSFDKGHRNKLLGGGRTCCSKTKRK